MFECSGKEVGLLMSVFCFQAEDGIRDLVRSRGLGDVYKRQRGHHSRYAVNETIASGHCVQSVSHCRNDV
mgnify:CR=1 FL=1